MYACMCVRMDVCNACMYVCMCGAVADWLERSACNAESKGSSLVRDSYCVYDDLEQVPLAQNCSAILQTASAPPRPVRTLLSLACIKTISKINCIVCEYEHVCKCARFCTC